MKISESAFWTFQKLLTVLVITSLSKSLYIDLAKPKNGVPDNNDIDDDDDNEDVSYFSELTSLNF